MNGLDQKLWYQKKYIYENDKPKTREQTKNGENGFVWSYTGNDMFYTPIFKYAERTKAINIKLKK